MERVSVLLGHSSIKVAEKHSSPWVRARQEQLEADSQTNLGPARKQGDARPPAASDLETAQLPASPWFVVVLRAIELDETQSART
jgi:hypothetical protein